MEHKKPVRAIDKRPDNKPYYIKSNCPTCKENLELADKVNDPKINEDDIWHDEWMCPICKDGIYLDWPDDSVKNIIFKKDSLIN